jgi:hypothetical protein
VPACRLAQASRLRRPAHEARAFAPNPARTRTHAAAQFMATNRRMIQAYLTQAILPICLMFALISIMMGCSPNPGKDYELSEQSFTKESLQMVEKETGIKMPDGARGLNLLYRGSKIDPSFVARIEIPAASLLMVSNQIAKYPDREVKIVGSLTEQVSWWNRSENSIRIKRVFDGKRVMLCQEKELWILYVEYIRL